MIDQFSNHTATPSPSRQFASAAVLVLFLMRFYDVTESAGQGDTLWIVALWFLGLMVWALISFWSNSDGVSFGWLDLGVGLLAGSHVVSALVVVGTSGEKRSAICLAWEWAGVFVGWFLLRQECRSAAFRREILVGLIATGTAVAGLGLYQHYVEFSQLSAKYGPLFDQLKSANPAEADRIRQILNDDHIPTEEPGITLFEKRLRDSREPFGLFALANTLGGFLSVCLVFAVSTVTGIRKGVHQGEWKRLVVQILVIGLLGWCLLLTKSRTAWIGTAAGLMLWSFGLNRMKVTWARLSAIGGVLAMLGIVGWGLSRIGGLDKQVLTEASKSLKYRLQYWSATVPIIRDHLWLGVGPGQFRSYYLYYKLPEASEEIADPHNLFLDVAANGGLIALVSLLAICVSLSIKCRPQNDQISSRQSLQVVPFVPSVVFLLTAFAWCVLLCTGYDDRLVVLLPIAAILFWGLRRILGFAFDHDRTVRIASQAAAFSLFVHLLGAGGIGMPAISLLLLMLIAIADAGPMASTKPSWRNSKGLAAIAILSFGLLVAVFATGIRPVSIVQAKLQSGDRLVQKGRLEAADAEYSSAAEADPVFAEPWRKRAELAYRKAETDRFRSNESFLNAVRLMREAESRDPADFHDERRLGEWWLSRWNVTKELKDGQEAVAAFEHAWNRYPTNGMLMAELAFALDATGSTRAASEVAGKAIAQDKINRQRQHVDRYLADSVRARLERLSANATDD